MLIHRGKKEKKTLPLDFGCAIYDLIFCSKGKMKMK
jgi:hypothetical protein